MVVELARIRCQAGRETEFEQRSLEALAVAATAPGAGRFTIHHGIEDPQEFVFAIEWASVEAHQAFRASDLFGSYRAPIQPLFEAPPQFMHYTVSGPGARAAADRLHPSGD